MWYNNTRSGAHGPISVSTKLKKHSSHLFAAKYQSHGMNHAQSISCYAFLFFIINYLMKKPSAYAEGFDLFFVSFFKILTNLSIHFFVNLKFLMIEEETNKYANKRKNHHRDFHNPNR